MISKNQQYTTRELNKSGIYSILNLSNGKQYIGSTTKSFRMRWDKHKIDLRNNKHHSIHLQHSWNKYGKEMFQFIIVEYCEPEHCLIREQHYIDSLNVCDTEFGYNICSIAGNCFGVKASDETKAKMSLAGAGRKLSEKHKAKIGLSNKDKKHTDETKAKMSLVHTGVKLSEEHRAKIGLAGTRRRHSDETKAKIGLSNKDKKHTDEARAKISLGHQKTYIVTDPNNIEITTHNLKEFCETNKLRYSCMLKTINGMAKQHKGGWKCRLF